DFCDSRGAFARWLRWRPSPIQRLVPKLSRFIDKARKAGALVVFSQMINSTIESPPNLRKKLASGAEEKAGCWPFGLARGSWGWRLYRLQPKRRDIVLEKRYYDLFSNPLLKRKLAAHGIERLIVTGVYTEVCVLSTALHGFMEWFEVVVPRDLTASVAQREHLRKAALEILHGYAADVVGSSELL
ncbi:MAG TPA: isochorismatase family cysteine hydrolase, partial [archaeon]|nr:isochorismatase family cysteine hydrolase [archaeon]